jgi:hypothetical protein
VVLLIVLPGFKIACNLAVVPFRFFNVANMCEVMAGPGLTVGVGYCLMFLLMFFTKLWKLSGGGRIVRVSFWWEPLILEEQNLLCTCKDLFYVSV